MLRHHTPRMLLANCGGPGELSADAKLGETEALPLSISARAARSFFDYTSYLNPMLKNKMASRAELLELQSEQSDVFTSVAREFQRLLAAADITVFQETISSLEQGGGLIATCSRKELKHESTKKACQAVKELAYEAYHNGLLTGMNASQPNLRRWIEVSTAEFAQGVRDSIEPLIKSDPALALMLMALTGLCLKGIAFEMLDYTSPTKNYAVGTFFSAVDEMVHSWIYSLAYKVGLFEFPLATLKAAGDKLDGCRFQSGKGPLREWISLSSILSKALTASCYILNREINHVESTSQLHTVVQVGTKYLQYRNDRFQETSMPFGLVLMALIDEGNPHLASIVSFQGAFRRACVAFHDTSCVGGYWDSSFQENFIRLKKDYTGALNFDSDGNITIYGLRHVGEDSIRKIAKAQEVEFEEVRNSAHSIINAASAQMNRLWQKVPSSYALLQRTDPLIVIPRQDGFVVLSSLAVINEFIELSGWSPISPDQAAAFVKDLGIQCSEMLVGAIESTSVETAPPYAAGDVPIKISNAKQARRAIREYFNSNPRWSFQELLTRLSKAGYDIEYRTDTGSSHHPLYRKVDNGVRMYTISPACRDEKNGLYPHLLLAILDGLAISEVEFTQTLQS